jgi:hypothetical protein
MPLSAWIMLIVGCLLLYGSLAWSIIVGVKAEKNKS